jgi:hypothetical protein
MCETKKSLLNQIRKPLEILVKMPSVSKIKIS